jgi:hypothetical protein
MSDDHHSGRTGSGASSQGVFPAVYTRKVSIGAFHSLSSYRRLLGLINAAMLFDSYSHTIAQGALDDKVLLCLRES